MKIAVLIAVWQRPGITVFTMNAMTQSMEEAKQAGIELYPVYIVSEKWAMREAQSVRGFHTVYTPNDPLGRKLNTGLNDLRRVNFDYLMLLGSDDIVHPAYWQKVRDAIADGWEYFGMNKCLFYDSRTGQAKEWNGTSIMGAGRIMPRKFVEQMNFRLWTGEKNKVLDNDSAGRIAEKVGYFPRPLAVDRPMICDVKSAVNIWPFEKLQGRLVSRAVALSLFPALWGLEKNLSYAVPTEEE